ncbi:MAG: acyltransferase [Oscillospiraceae bacterium]|nr:acyltransferase [Oscillospiraceae bacterium]
MEKRSLTHLELFRVIAIYWVMFNHTGTNGFFLFSISEDSLLYPVYLFMSIGCKFAVPLFFMVSGALLLGKNESIGTVYKKRVLRMVIVLVVISLLYQVYDCVRGGTAFQLGVFLKTLYSSRLSTALWYLYAYLAIMSMLPLLRRMAQHMTANEYVYLAGMSILLVGVIPILQYRLGLDTVTINSNLKGALFTATNVVYFLMGYFFEHILSEEHYNRKNAVIGIVLSLLSIGVCCYMTVFRARVTGECNESVSQVFHNSLVAIPTYTIYYCGKLLFMRRHIPDRVQRAIRFLGGTTFGIYLLERMLRDQTKFVFTALKPYIHTMPACLIWILCAFILGAAVTWVLKKIPGIKKFI